MSDARVEELKSLLPRCLLHDWVRLGARAVRLFRDGHHPAAHDAILNRLLDQARASVQLCEDRRTNVPRVTYPPELPVSGKRADIVAAIRNNQVVIIAGETGSGKTTQIPKMCLEAGLGIEGKIGCTQPRRVAALSISKRIAEELGVGWGREVGCKIRFDDRSSDLTFIKLMTDGILLAETQGDPLLSEYNAIIVDEAHERSLNIDFLLGYLKGLLARRTDLKLIITSATIDTGSFSRAFGNAPIIEVSGRMYPVETLYAPIDAGAEDEGELTYIDAAVRATEQLLCEPGDGDILIFMPGERDIRETTDQLEGRYSSAAEVVPLYGRLSSGDQQRVFAPSSRRKIVIATNIAETSLTIPGIRYVIDAGFARISRYNPRTRTKRLPVEPVSQSSANQRKGRCGRVQNGTCIRLYSEEDFLSRPPFTQPEIQRSNLAEVILRMKAFQLGEIETFPFIDPPTPAAIQSGYSLLQELGALDTNRVLTPLGQDLARLPIDPTLGRMLLQSQHEHATRELLIIASGLSIQDPRERPSDQKDAAAAAHKRFENTQSDFLTLLNIWNAVHDQWENLRTQGLRRRFCKTHFLSYIRMREWQDLHAQLHGALADLVGAKLNDSNAAYEAIHRSILTGLLGHVALRNERNEYKAAGNRLVTVFPGSALYQRFEKQKKPQHRGEAADERPKAPSQPMWIVAGEIVETSQLFARTLAGIDPHWIVQLAPHLCKVVHQNPHWSASSGRVLIEERMFLYGLEVQARKVAYGNINPKDATAIFIRSALVEDNLSPDQDENDRHPDGQSRARLLKQATAIRPERQTPYKFLEHNRAVREKIENWQTRVRHHDLGDVDQALFDFYAAHLENVSSLHELNRFIAEQNDPQALFITEQDLAGDNALHYDPAAFPDAVTVSGQPTPLKYAYAPGEEWDGVTIHIEAGAAQGIPGAAVEWSIPGLREEQVTALLQSLPKALRKALMPLPPKVVDILQDLKPTSQSLVQDLGRFIHLKYGVEVPLSSWRLEAVPAHLRPRIEIVGEDRKIIASGRDLQQLVQQLPKAGKPVKPDVSPDWKRACQKWERFGVSGWNFGDLPERVTVSESGDLPVYAWIAICHEESNVNVRLARHPDVARRQTIAGVQRLIELAMGKEFAWLEKDLRGLSKIAPLANGFLSFDELQAGALASLRNYILPSEPLPALTTAHFLRALEESRLRLRGITTTFTDRLTPILQLRQQIVVRAGTLAAPAITPAKPKPRTLSDLSQLGNLNPPAAPAPLKLSNAFASELQSLLPPDFLETTSFDRLQQFPRYLKALHTRVDRAAHNPAKDQERARLIAPYTEALRKLQSRDNLTAEANRLVDEFRWLVEEYKVSVFAQELGTAIPVSPKRLDQHLEQLRQTTGMAV
ncbi:MAG TPA: ATP-dependent RNA helicase HrpA [Candidatus Limnocylindria bacterium]|nr:ATP-dependent RNA helicase HrpA [Candidatus Limnocylindria bacterium]